MLQIIKDFEVLNKLQDELKDAFSKQINWNFQSPTFILAIYETYFNNKENKLYFVVNKSNNKIVSYIPLYIDKFKTLRFIFDKHTDYCGVVGVKPDFDFFKDLSKLIITDKRIQRVDLDNLLPNDSLLNYLKNNLGNGANISSYNSHSFISSDSDIGYLNTLKSKYKSELKRVQNKAIEYDFRIYEFPDDFPENDIIYLRDKMIKKKLRDKSFFDTQFIEMAKKLYASNQLILISKWDKNKLLSLVVVIKNNYQKLFTFWITLYEENIKYINLSTYLDFISLYEKRDFYFFSFGRGYYDFKSKFCPSIENLFNLRYSKSRFDFFFCQYYSIKQFSKRLVREKI